MSIEYRELVPHPDLRPFVRCLWRMVSAGSCTDAEPVVPDGCPEIVLNRGDAFRRLADDGGSHVQADVLLVGQLRRPISIAPTGQVDLFGVRFEPGGLFAMLGVPMHELTGEDVCLSQVVARLHRRLSEASAVADELELVERVEAVLLDELARRSSRAGLAAAAVRAIERGDRTTEAIAASLGVNRRGLERLFRHEVGLSPKLLVRIRRVQAVLARLEGGGPAAGWASVAAAHGFSDQSHLIRDFRLIVGTTPARYVAERGELAPHFCAAVAGERTPASELSRSSNR